VTWLVLAGYAQLRLARQVAGDQRLPWERPEPNRDCHPTGCAAAFRSLWLRSAHRRPRRNPQDVPQNDPRAAAQGPTARYPAIKKPAKRPRKKPPTTAEAA
jgi:hypothetical protein